jgi:hypothetical protein
MDDSPQMLTSATSCKRHVSNTMQTAIYVYLEEPADCSHCINSEKCVCTSTLIQRQFQGRREADVVCARSASTASCYPIVAVFSAPVYVFFSAPQARKSQGLRERSSRLFVYDLVDCCSLSAITMPMCGFRVAVASVTPK